MTAKKHKAKTAAPKTSKDLPGIVALREHAKQKKIQERRNQLVLPDSVGHVLSDHQDALFKVRAVLRSVIAVRDAEADEGFDITYAIEAAADLLEPVAMRLETGAVSMDAATREINEASAEESHA